MPHSYCNLLYHIVFSTKRHCPFLDAADIARIHEYLGGTIRNMGNTSLGVGGTTDHIHLLVKLHQKAAVADVLRDFKSTSSGWMKRTFPRIRDFAWQEGYGAFTVSQSQVGKVRKYIANQVAHHHKTTFKEEFLGLLQAHGIEYDERYLWK